MENNGDEIAVLFPEGHETIQITYCREMVVANKGNSHFCRFSPDLIFFHFVGTRRRSILS